jgi:hypothetical protein
MVKKRITKEANLSKEKIFYVYVYMDPQVKGIWEYKDIKLDYKPFYIGKGKNKRFLTHLEQAEIKIKKNQKVHSRKLRKIIKILRKNLSPIIRRVVINLDEKSAYDLEAELIGFFRRKDEEGGILMNYDGGGYKGYTASLETRKKQSISAKIDRARPERHAQLIEQLDEARPLIDYESRSENELYIAHMDKLHEDKKGKPSWNSGKKGYKLNQSVEAKAKKAQFCKDNFSKPKSEEHKEKIRVFVKHQAELGLNHVVKSGKENYKSRQILEFDSDMKLVREYDTVLQAAKELNTYRNKIMFRCRSGKILDGKYYKYKSDYEIQQQNINQ